MTLLVTVILSGCQFATVSKSSHSNSEEFERLCREESGLKIYETVRNVEGVMDSVFDEFCVLCEDGLFWYGYKFIEFVVLPGQTKDNLAYKPGLHRYTLENVDHPNCKPFVNKYKNTVKSYLGLPSKFDNSCIASKKVKNSNAMYKVIRVTAENWNNPRPGEILETSMIFSDSGETKIYARDRLFKYVPIDGKKDAFRGKYIAKICPSVDKTRKPSEVLKIVFNPN
ncbi:MAG: hypothetical protein GKS00_19505 [Alphaproteobacteria bacterium]|nr:hypothetical protein [Alphaproteobacteria bacterium]